MKTGAEDKKKLAILAVVGVVALGAVYYIYSELFSSPPTPAPAAVTAPAVATHAAPAAKAVETAAPPGNAAGRVAKTVGTASTLLDPTLKMGPMLVTEGLVYSGNGRNIFSLTSVPVAIPRPLAPARPKGPVVPVVLQPT